MFLASTFVEPAVIVETQQVAQAESPSADGMTKWNMSGWIFVAPTTKTEDPITGENPLIVVDKDGKEVELKEGSYKIPGLLKYENPVYYIIMNETEFLSSGYRLAIKKTDSDEVNFTTATYTQTEETSRQFRFTDSDETIDILSLDKIRTMNAVEVDGEKIISRKTETIAIEPEELIVQAEVSSDELQIPSAFPDIKSPLLREAVAYLSERDIIKGYADGTFQPDRVINRAEALKIIFESVGIETVIPSEAKESEPDSLFPDVPKSEWFAPYVAQAKARGFIKGYADGTYRPNQSVNKVEFLKIALSAQSSFTAPTTFTSALSQFSDLGKSEWYMPFVTYAVEHGFLDKTTKLKPNDGMTRGEAAMIIYRVMKEREE